ncbi:MAG TPA: response regulator transcription factor [Thermomicrobiales bacterium]|nr:response regulator transcription factor [Thermomicrobiales bacterium]
MTARTVVARTSKQTVRVLLVDDHPVVRSGLSMAIARGDDLVVVGELGEGRDVARACERLRPDVVVIDINLPDMTGLEVTSILKAHFPDVRVLMVSTYADDEYVLGALEAGADGYLVKQCAVEELQSGILRVFAGERVLHPSVMQAVITKATRKPSLPAESLSGRELEILRLLADGGTSKEIAVQLGLSPKTIENYRARILDKLGVANSTAAIHTAIARGIIPPPGQAAKPRYPRA